MRQINCLVIHCSDNLPNQDVGALELRVLHTTPPPRGMGWNDIGYHFVIPRSGVIEPGRPIERIGAHVAGFNAHSIGICLVGGRAQIAPPRYAANFSLPQWDALKDLVVRLKREYPHAGILDHRDFPEVAKECPCFDVAAWATREGLAAGIMP